MGEEQALDTHEPIPQQSVGTTPEGSDGQATQPDGVFAEQHLDVPRTDQEPPAEQTPNSLAVSQTAVADGDELVRDQPKAWDMAHAANEDRGYAADLRREIIEHKSENNVNSQTPEGVEESNDSHWKQLSPEKLQSESRELDKLADKVENWAGIMHDHPISEAYAETHDGVDFDPYMLANIENDIEKRMDQVKTVDDGLGKLDLRVGVMGLPKDAKVDGVMIFDLLPSLWSPSLEAQIFDFDPHTVVSDAYGTEPKEGKPDMEPDDVDGEGRWWVQNREKWQEFNSLLEDPNTTLRQLRDFYIGAFRTAYISPEINKANILKSVLEDVRSGRASARQ